MNTLCKHYPGLSAVQQRGESVHGQAKLPWDPSQRPRPAGAEAPRAARPRAPALPRTETAQTGQHELPTLLWQRVNSALEGTHLGMFLLHIQSGLTLSVKTAKGSKLVSSVMGFSPSPKRPWTPWNDSPECQFRPDEEELRPDWPTLRSHEPNLLVLVTKLLLHCCSLLPIKLQHQFTSDHQILFFKILII